MFGGCGCGRNTVVNGGASDSQCVIAFVLFNMGWIGVVPTNDPETPGANEVVPNPLGNVILNLTQIPDTIYLTNTIQWFYQGTLVGTTTETYDNFGNLTTTGEVSGWGPDGPRWIINTLSNPYTISDANNRALALLGMVQFGGSYSVTPSPGAATVQMQLCYASESAAYAHSTQVMWVFYKPPLFGNPADGEVIYTNNIGSWDFTEGILPNTFALGANGYFGIDGGAGGNDAFDIYCQVAKTICRTPVPLQSKTTSTYTPGQPITAGFGITTPITNQITITEPINDPPGEYPMSPGDAGGYGAAYLSTAPAPPLPPV
jgi:hypothetical protein